MRRADAYSALANELAQWSTRPSAELLALVNAPADRIVVSSNGEEIEIEVSVTWVDSDRKVVRVSGIANGPNAWRLERLEESTVVPLSSPENHSHEDP
jgi:hypothetical protein